jgi:hypothetical protein
MDEILQKQFVARCLQDIVKFCWSDDKENALGIIHARANLALVVLLASDEERTRFWEGLADDFKYEVEFTSLDFDAHFVENLRRGLDKIKEKRKE